MPPPKRKSDERGDEFESKEQGESSAKDDQDCKPAAQGGEEDAKTRASDQSKKSKSTWTDAEDDALLKAVLEDQQDRDAEGNGDDEEDWDEIAKAIPNKTPVQCLKRYMSLNKKGITKGIPETPAEAPEMAAPPPPPPPPPTPLSAAATTAASGDDAPDSPEMNPPPAKKPKKEADTSSRWTTDEIELLKKLVEQYKDSELNDTLKVQGETQRWILFNPYSHFVFTLKLRLVGTKWLQTFMITTQLIALLNGRP